MSGEKKVVAPENASAAVAASKNSMSTGLIQIGNLSRRTFLKGAAVTGAAATVAGCAEKGEELIYPYVRGEADQIPGKAVWFRSTCGECSTGCGIQVRTREGRAVKIEGSSDHPVNQGKLCALGQSSLQALYDPDRVRQPISVAERGINSSAHSKGLALIRYETKTWESGIKAISTQLKEPKKKYLVTRELTGSLLKLVSDFSKNFGVEHVTFEPTEPVAVARASELVYGTYGIPQYKIGEADVILNFGADFLESWVSPVEYARDWAVSRRSTKPVRLVHVEPRLSMTGSNADNWIACTPGTEVKLALYLLKASIASGRASQLPSAVASRIKTLTKDLTLSAVSLETGISEARISIIERYLSDAEKPLVLSGSASTATSEQSSISVAAALLNVALGAVGTTVLLQNFRKPATSAKGVEKLMSDLSAGPDGSVSLLMTYGTNLAFTVPQALGYEYAVRKAGLAVSFDSFKDETAEAADWILPTNHFLEDWGDNSPVSGFASLTQPVMRPLYDTRSLGDVLIAIAKEAGKDISGGATSYLDYLKAQWKDVQSSVGDSRQFETFWTAALEKGGVASDKLLASAVPFQPRSELAVFDFLTGAFDDGLATEAAVVKTEHAHAGSSESTSEHSSEARDLKPMIGGLLYADNVHEVESETSVDVSVVAFSTMKASDGKAANRPWMLELPEPVTQTVWDAWAEVHPSTAAKIGLADRDFAVVRNAYGEVRVPVYITNYIQPGVVAIPFGYGHTAFGRYAQFIDSGRVSSLLPKSALSGDSLALTSAKAKLIRGVGRSKLVSAQGSDLQHHRPIAKTEFIETGAPAMHEIAEMHEPEEPWGEDPKQMYQQRGHPLYQWGMSIDLNSCTGCSACVVACYAENNVAVVGKKQYSMGRDMAWINVNRYIDGDETNPQFSYIPFMCQQCQNAPCEPVCPVFATYHNEDGLNAMVYNRCVGTRYCSNNCPYKARRFNWFEYDLPEPMSWQLNPDVVKRGLGVMEKCTFCIQRINEGKDKAKDLGRTVREGEITPACVQTCPTSAIKFGNLLDPKSRVSRESMKPGTYKILDEHINTQPSVSYHPRRRYQVEV